jgi:hypothetical protein
MREGDHKEDPGVDGRIILKYIFVTSDNGQGLDRSDLGYRQVAGFCEYCNKPSVSTKCGEFEFLRTFQLLRKTCAA